MGVCNTLRPTNNKSKLNKYKQETTDPTKSEYTFDNTNIKNKESSPSFVSKSSDKFETSISDNTKSSGKATFTSTRRSSLIDPSRRGSLIHKSKFSPSSCEELKICVTTRYLIDELNDVPTNKYRIINKIGEGGFGTVFYTKNLLNQSEVAMKKIVKSQDNLIDDLDISNEIDILKKLDHPNVFKVYEFYNTQSAFFIMGEYCKKGDLFKHRKGSLSEHQLAVIFYQIFSGLNYLHRNGIIHRDLKLENILISDIETDEKTKEDLYWIKLIDFGCAKFFNKKKNEKTIVGTSYYMAPEVINKKYTQKCDIWSVGVILYMLITGSTPFDGHNDDEIIKSIKVGKYNKFHSRLWKMSPEIKDLLSKLLESKEDKRLSAQDALNHPWFAKFDGKYLINNLPSQDYEKYMENLSHFVLRSKFQQIVLAYLCHNLPSNKETQTITKLFLQMNKSNTGHLTKEELLFGLSEYIGKFEAKDIIDEIFISLDGDNNGFIEYSEFLRACVDKETILNDQLLQYAFKFFDKDNTNKITLEEIKAIFRETYDNKDIDTICANIIDNHDVNKDGVIDYLDFKKILSNSVIS